MREDFQKILHHPHHISTRHAPMSKSSRASKFSAFKALDGHEEMIAEEARLTAAKRTLTDDKTAELNKTLCSLIDREYENVKVKILYFKPDGRKSGGAYAEYMGTFKYYRSDLNRLVFTDDFKVNVGDIAGVEIL